MAKLRNRRYSSKRNQLACQLLTTALRTELGTTLLIGVLRHTTAKTAYFHCSCSIAACTNRPRIHKSLAALPRSHTGPHAIEALQRGNPRQRLDPV
jgi:hypothetical protein